MQRKIAAKLNFLFKNPYLLIIAVFFVVSFFFGPKVSDFDNRIVECNKVEEDFRFSCYREAIEKYYKDDIDAFSKRILDSKSFENKFFAGNRDITYGGFGTNCHTFYHAAGDFVATYDTSQDLKQMLDLGPKSCTSGYVMGVYKRTALKNNFDSELLKKFWELCPEGSQNQCAHEIGHNLHDKYSYAVLKVVDDISFKNYGLVYPQSYKYITFPETDLDAPFKECRELMPDQLKIDQCYTGVGHNLFVFSEFSPDGYKTVFNECNEADEENRENCFAFLIYRIGINHAAPLFLSNNIEGGIKVCDEAVTESGREEMGEHCYTGLGGGIGLFIDSEYGNLQITEKNIAFLQKELFEKAGLCEKIPGEFINNCLAGLMGTKFGKLYEELNLFDERIEKIIPFLNKDFQVVG